jgi:hypothetical protein
MLILELFIFGATFGLLQPKLFFLFSELGIPLAQLLGPGGPDLVDLVDLGGEKRLVRIASGFNKFG